MFDQFDYRYNIITKFMEEKNIRPEELHAVVARGDS
jgi:butyrate kinase